MSDTHAESVAFVRTEPVPSAPPPFQATGPVKWIRENLFANVPNTILTLVALYAIYVVLSAILP